MDRTIQPEIQTLKNFRILPPVRMTLPNGIPLTVINAGEQEVVRIDVLFAGGRWQQSQKLQALFTNRMLREGTKKYYLLWNLCHSVPTVDCRTDCKNEDDCGRAQPSGRKL